jgi:hypothetical protein
MFDRGPGHLPALFRRRSFSSLALFVAGVIDSAAADRHRYAKIMIFSENRFPPFRIMLSRAPQTLDHRHYSAAALRNLADFFAALRFPSKSRRDTHQTRQKQRRPPS